MKTGKEKKAKFTDPLNLLTLDNPDDEALAAKESARYLCYVVAEGDYDKSKRLYEEATISEVWNFYKLRLADIHGKNAVNS